MYEMKNSIKFSFPSPIEVHINIILSRVFSSLRKRKKRSKKIPERIGLKRIIILKMKLETEGEEDYQGLTWYTRKSYPRQVSTSSEII